MLIYMKGYNYKLCYKGLLERGKAMGKAMGKSFGDLKDLENEFLNKVSNPNCNINVLLSDLQIRKMESVEKEILQTKKRMEALTKTMDTVKQEVNAMTDDFYYGKWLKRINESSLKFKKLYSEEMNSQYNHYFKMNGKFEETLRSLATDVRYIKNNICGPFNIKREILASPTANYQTIKKSRIEASKYESTHQNSSQQNSSTNNIHYQPLNATYSRSCTTINLQNDSGFADSDEDISITEKRKNDFHLGGNASTSADPDPIFTTVDEVGNVDVSDFDEEIKKYVN